MYIRFFSNIPNLLQKVIFAKVRAGIGIFIIWAKRI